MARALPKSDEKEQIGRFCLHELLYSGSMAEIWLATDERGRSVALRRLKRDLRFNLHARRRFARGCEVLSQLNESEHIVGYVEHGRDWLVMDYHEAENLQALFARQDPVLTENVAQILIDMAVGLSHIHESGYLHLDFKPDNILISRDGRVRLIDFDHALPIPEKPVKAAKNSAMPGYLAPEQLRAGPVDARTDIFAYGVAAYELLTNSRPFPGETPEEILTAQGESAGPVPLREYNPDTPAALEKVVLKCLERDPERRYPLTGVLVRELQNALYV
jgi:serine/threonine-protein kinase